MGNNVCLVTELKGTVTGLTKRLGVIRFPLNPTESYQFMIPKTPNAGDCVITIVDSVTGIVTTRESRNASSPSSFVTVSVPNGGYFEINNKYSLVDFSASNVDIINDAELLPDIEEYYYCDELTSLALSQVKRTDISKLANIESVTSTNATYWLGDIKDYIERRIENGTTSGSLQFKVYEGDVSSFRASSILINGTPVKSVTNSVTYKDSLIWESGTKYYWLLDERTKVYIHGYTDQEITSMRQSGGVLERVTNDNNVIKV
jgi:hypothetical protein